MRLLHKNHWKAITFILLIGGGYLAFYSMGWDEYLDLAYVKQHRNELHNYVKAHYELSVAVFMAVYVATAFFLPGAVILTLLGGFLFDVLPAALYINIGGTVGAILALLVSRYLVGDWIQARYVEQLKTLNEAIDRHGAPFLLVFRIIPVFPFFAVNYLAGLTRIPIKTFVWTTSLGILPGSILYAYVGRELGSIERPQDILSFRLLIAITFLGLLSLLPFVYKHVRTSRKRV
ncbi:MAG: TVP38/TMEM64 family protein [Geobacter sp.]|nr:MAG: TVP38/TMEM64 family protein [Geobacter sp.]